jgi:hypothetical protein
MHLGKTVFAQLMDFIPAHEFRRCVNRYQGNHKVSSFSCWDQFLAMAFAQLTYRESLRDIETCLRALGSHLYHLGIRGQVSRSTLADANETRDFRIYADLAQGLIATARRLYADEDFGVDLEQTVYALDCTTIDLCLSLFPWARYRAQNAAVKMHTLLAHHLSDTKQIFAVEEPEIHLHPELTKKMFSWFGGLAEGGCQLLVSTHSPFVADRSMLPGLWLFTKKNKETEARRLKGREELKHALFELGVRPSDLLFADAVLIVPGYTEKVVLPFLASKMGIEFADIGVAVVPSRGEYKAKYHLKMWAEIAKDVDVPVFLLLDGDAKPEGERAKKAGLVDKDNFFVLPGAGIEDSYPEDILRQEFERLFGAEPPLGQLPAQGRAKFLEKKLQKEDKIRDGWKVELGEAIAPQVGIDFLPPEVKALFQRIVFVLRQD